MTEHKNITEAIAAIMAEVGAIGKNHQAAAQQGGYRYRGIEDITERLQPLLAKHKVVFYPQAAVTETRELVVNGKPWTDTVLNVTYEIVHGPSDTYRVVCVPGIGRDNSDKGSNKAMTQAFKYALLQTFCISDPKDDADAGSPEADSRASRSSRPRPAPVGSGNGTPLKGEMSPREVRDALVAAGLDPSGSIGDMRQRLAAHLAGANPQTGEIKLDDYSEEPF